MSCFVYRYIDIATEIIKYVGIVCKKKDIGDRVAEHRRDDAWFTQCEWRIEYIEVENQSVAEAIESHLISLWRTDKWFNQMKAGWGVNPYLPKEFEGWAVWVPKLTYKDYTGQRFGKLVAIKRVANRYSEAGNQQTMWEFQCDCGNIITANISSVLRSGKTSCGCDTKEKQSKTHCDSKTHLFKHGFQSKSTPPDKKKIYVWWRSMGDKRSHEFADINSFYKWVINHPDYSPEKYLVRLDKDGMYSPDNCVFLDHNVPSGNKKMLTYNGVTKTTTEWAAIFGITRDLINTRLRKGYSVEQALTTPLWGKVNTA